MQILSKRTKIKAIFFDAGGTLLEVYPSVGEVYSRIAKKYGCTAAPEKIQKLFWREFNKQNSFSLRKIHSSEIKEKNWWKEIVSKIFSHFEPIQNFDEFFEELYELFASPSVWKLYPETKNVLQELKKRGTVLGVVSNWDSRLLKILKGLKLTDLFDVIVISALVGAAKPDPEIFKLAISKAKVKPEECLYIGDRFVEDYCGASSCGMIPLLISRNSNSHPRAKTIHTLRELLTFL